MTAPERRISTRAGVLIGLGAVVLLVFAFGLVSLREPDELPAENFSPMTDAVLPADDTRALVGCLQATGEPDVFMLAVAEPVEEVRPGTPRLDPAPRIPPAAGVPQTPPVAGTGEPPGDRVPSVTEMTTYRLVDAEGFDLGTHEGHTVEVTGRIESGDAGEFPRLHVEAFRHVSSECGTP